MNALRVVCLLLVAVALAVAVGAIRARRVTARERRQDRRDYARRAAGDQALADFRTARDFATTVRLRLLETFTEYDARLTKEGR